MSDPISFGKGSRFCRTCGSPLLLETGQRFYDELSGEERCVVYFTCPRATKPPRFQFFGRELVCHTWNKMDTDSHWCGVLWTKDEVETYQKGIQDGI